MAWDRHWTRSAEARRIAARCAVAGVAAAAVLAFGTLLVARAILAGGGCDLDETFGPNARLEMLLVTAAAIVGIECAAFGIFVWLRQRSIEATYRARRRLRPGVDPDDPDLTVHFECMVDALGCRFVSRGLDQEMIWALVPRLDETADHMFFVVATARAYIVPKRDLPPALILAIRDLARDEVAGETLEVGRGLRRDGARDARPRRRPAQKPSRFECRQITVSSCRRTPTPETALSRFAPPVTFVSRFVDIGRLVCRGTLTSVGRNVRAHDGREPHIRGRARVDTAASVG